MSSSNISFDSQVGIPEGFGISRDNLHRRQPPVPFVDRIAEVMTKTVPRLGVTVEIENTRYKIKEFGKQGRFKSFKIKHDIVFESKDLIYKNRSHSCRKWILKIFNPLMGNALFRDFENTRKTIQYLKDNQINHPECLITPETYKHPTNGKFWVVRKISKEIDISKPQVVAFIKNLYNLNVINPDKKLKIFKENIRLDKHDVPYFTGMSMYSGLSLKESIEEELFKLIQDGEASENSSHVDTEDSISNN